MKYMLIMRATDEAIEAAAEIPFEQIIEDMGRFNEALVKAGVMLGGEGLRGPEEGFVIDFSSTPPLVTDGPYGETKELFGGFWLIEVATTEEAIEWAKRVPLGPGSKIELRRVTEMADFSQDNETIQREVALRAEVESANG